MSSARLSKKCHLIYPPEHCWQPTSPGGHISLNMQSRHPHLRQSKHKTTYLFYLYHSHQHLYTPSCGDTEPWELEGASRVIYSDVEYPGSDLSAPSSLSQNPQSHFLTSLIIGKLFIIWRWYLLPTTSILKFYFFQGRPQGWLGRHPLCFLKIEYCEYCLDFFCLFICLFVLLLFHWIRGWQLCTLGNSLKVLP